MDLLEFVNKNPKAAALLGPEVASRLTAEAEAKRLRGTTPLATDIGTAPVQPATATPPAAPVPTAPVRRGFLGAMGALGDWATDHAPRPPSGAPMVGAKDAAELRDFGDAWGREFMGVDQSALAPDPGTFQPHAVMAPAVVPPPAPVVAPPALPGGVTSSTGDAFAALGDSAGSYRGGPDNSFDMRDLDSIKAGTWGTDRVVLPGQSDGDKEAREWLSASGGDSNQYHMPTLAELSGGPLQRTEGGTEQAFWDAAETGARPLRTGETMTTGGPQGLTWRDLHDPESYYNTLTSPAAVAKTAAAEASAAHDRRLAADPSYDLMQKAQADTLPRLAEQGAKNRGDLAVAQENAAAKLEEAKIKGQTDQATRTAIPRLVIGAVDALDKWREEQLAAIESHPSGDPTARAAARTALAQKYRAKKEAIYVGAGAGSVPEVTDPQEAPAPAGS